MQSLSKRFVFATLTLGLALAVVPGTGTSFAGHPALQQPIVEQSAPGCMRNPPPTRCKIAPVPGPSDRL